MVDNNLPYEFEKTAGNYETKKQINTYLLRSTEQKLKIGQARIKNWDKGYFEKSEKWQSFIKTKKMYLNIFNPVHILRSEFENIFGQIPYTQNPKKITEMEFSELSKIAGLEIEI